MWPEIPPVEPFESGIEELTGVRPYKGTLMYYRQLGVYDPYEAAEAPAPYPGVRAADVIYYLEQSHHKHQPARHTVQGQRVRANTTDTFRSQAPRKTRQQTKAPRESRELIGPPRPGRATELFQQGRARADNHVVDDSNVCPIFSRSKYKPGPRFTFTKSPWAAASESYIGDPREAFQESSSPPRERLCRQPPISKQYKHPSEPQLGYSEMDYSHAPRRSGGGGISQMYHNQAQQEIRSSDTWKAGSGSRPGQSFKRFHAGVVPYETDFNRKASGWQSNYFHEDPTDFIFAQDDFDAPGSNRGGGGGGGGQPQSRDYNPRPKSWQGGQQQEPEEEPWVPLNQRRQTFEQEDQSQYYQQQQQQQQQHHQPQRHPQQAQQHHQPQRHPQQAQQHRQPQRRPVQQQHQPHHQGHQAPRPAPRPQGRGSAADYAGPQTWDANTYESDDL